MEVHLNQKLEPVAYRQAEVKPRSAAVAADPTDFRQADGLNQALQATPDVRPDAVERGKQLIGDVAYPPLETMRRIAVLLVANLDGNSQ